MRHIVFNENCTHHAFYIMHPIHSRVIKISFGHLSMKNISFIVFTDVLGHIRNRNRLHNCTTSNSSLVCYTKLQQTSYYDSVVQLHSLCKITKKVNGILAVSYVISTKQIRKIY